MSVIKKIEASVFRYPLNNPVITSFGVMDNRPMVLIKIIDITGHNSKRVKDLLHILNGQGKVNALGHDLYLHQTQLNLIISILKKYFLNNKSMAVGDFKVITDKEYTHTQRANIGAFFHDAWV